MSAASALLLQLASFTPSRVRATADADAWQELTQLAPMHGLAPLCAYNLEYRLAGANAPQVVRDVLLSHYQGALADNVLKFVNLKKALTQCGDAAVMLLDAAAFADTLYPHIAFRPVSELRVLVQPAEVEVVQRGFDLCGYSASRELDPLSGAVVVTDSRTSIVLQTRLFPDARASEESGIWSRALPARAYGKNARRPALEDALLSAVLTQAKQAFDTPLINLMDLRELCTGALDLGGPYAQVPDREVVLARAKAFKLERALWVAMELVAELFTGRADAAHKLQPQLRGATQALLKRAVVEPLIDLNRTSAPRGMDRLRKLLAGV